MSGLCKYPRTGNTHFYERSVRSFQGIGNCVNALVRATLISTKSVELFEEVDRIV